MNKRVGFSRFLTFLLLFYSASLPVFPTQANNAKEGVELYVVRCAQCHGLDAQGSAQAARILQVDPWRLDLTRDSMLQKSADDLRRLVAGGHGKMRGHPDLNKNQIQTLVQYIRALQRTYALGREPRP